MLAAMGSYNFESKIISFLIKLIPIRSGDIFHNEIKYL